MSLDAAWESAWDGIEENDNAGDSKVFLDCTGHDILVCLKMGSHTYSHESMAIYK